MEPSITHSIVRVWGGVYHRPLLVVDRSDTSAAPSVPALIIDGKRVARDVEAEVSAEIAALGYQPGLVAVRVGNDPASEIYVRNKAKKAEELGLRGSQRILPDSTTEEE